MRLQEIDWPAFGLDDDVRPLLARLLDAGEPGVLATLHAAAGGSPRGVGTQMLFGPDSVTGYLSGGCVEADVALHAAEVLASGAPRRLIYGEGGPADVRLPCGGRIEVLVEAIGPDDPAAQRLIELWRSRRRALWLSDGRVRACLEPGEALEQGSPLAGALALALGGGVCGAVGEVLFRRADPQPRLVVIGSDPPALAMAGLGAQMGFAATLVRPKGPAAPPPLPGVAYLRSSPARALAEVGLDPFTCVAVAAHEFEVDHEALVAALGSPAGYVGVLGSRRRLPERLDALRAAGLDEAAVARLKAPIGLPLAGKSPWEIAVAVLGEVVQVLRAREAAEAWPAPAAGGLHAVVLAAGAGSRWGGAKLLAPFGDGRVIDSALAAAFEAPVGTVTVVTGAHADQVAAAATAFAAARADGARLRILHAPGWSQGLSASLRCGVEGLPPDAQGALLFLGDMPRIPHAVLKPLAEALAAGAPAAAAAFRGERGHPVAVSAALFSALCDQDGDRGAAAVLKRLGERLVLIEAPDEGVLFDVDEPADLEAAV